MRQILFLIIIVGIVYWIGASIVDRIERTSVHGNLTIEQIIDRGEADSSVDKSYPRFNKMWGEVK